MHIIFSSDLAELSCTKQQDVDQGQLYFGLMYRFMEEALPMTTCYKEVMSMLEALHKG